MRSDEPLEEVMERVRQAEEHLVETAERLEKRLKEIEKDNSLGGTLHTPPLDQNEGPHLPGLG